MRSYDSTAPVVPFAALALFISVIAVLLSGCGLSASSLSQESIPAYNKTSKRPYGLSGPRKANAVVVHRHAGETITIERGDTLIAIGKRYDVPMSVLIEENQLRSVVLRPGTTLFIPNRQIAAQN